MSASIKCAVAFGANLGDRHDTFQRATVLLSQSIGPIVRHSALRETEPLVLPGEDPRLHPKYLNAVFLLETTLSAEAVMEELLKMEHHLGRRREHEGSRWKPRVVDLDLIAYGEEQLVSTLATVPHPEMHKRDFVLVPFAEIWPQWQHPVLKKSVGELLDDLNARSN